MKTVNGKMLLFDDHPYEKELLQEALSIGDRFANVEYFLRQRRP